MRPKRFLKVPSTLFLPILAAACVSEPYQVNAPAVYFPDYGFSVEETSPDPVETSAEAEEASPEDEEISPEGAIKITKPRTLAMCYNAAFSDPAEVLARVQELCPNEGEVLRIKEDFFWNPCSLSKPTRATFICVPGLTPASKFN